MLPARAAATTSATHSRVRGGRCRFNLREGSDSNRNTAILSVGALGSGKTTLDQKLKYEGFLLGARVIDCDPKGDHRFHLLDDVAPHTECVTLRPDPALRGVLDPLRVAPAHLRQDAAVSLPARPASRQGGAGMGDGGRRCGRSCPHPDRGGRRAWRSSSAARRAIRSTRRSGERSRSTLAPG